MLVTTVVEQATLPPDLIPITRETDSYIYIMEIEWSGEKDTITKDMKKNQTLSRNQNQTEAFSYPKNSRNVSHYI